MNAFKKTIICIICFAVILIGSFFFIDEPENISTNSNKTTCPTVIIDAGHGGFDGGAVVADVMEKNINLKISNQLALMLKMAGFNVITTRTDDSSTESNPSATIASRKRSDLKNRLKLAKQNPNGIFVSVHLNKFSSPSAKGAQMFYSPNKDNAKVLAECLKTQVVEMLQKDNHRTTKKGTKDTYLLYYSPIPTVIAECGFMSNPDELKLLCSEKYQKQIAFALFIGIINYHSRM